VEWRDIPGFRGYQVSDDGQVKSLPRKWRKNERVLKSSNSNGYRTVTLSRDKQATVFLVHRAVLLAFVGPPLPGQEACHTDGNPSNNHLSNLRWGTHRQNMADNLVNGTRAMGELIAQHRLTSTQVIEMRLLRRMKAATNKEIGVAFGISQVGTCLIMTGKQWKHIGSTFPPIKREKA
jgi:hypothetical protein